MRYGMSRASSPSVTVSAARAAASESPLTGRGGPAIGVVSPGGAGQGPVRAARAGRHIRAGDAHGLQLPVVHHLEAGGVRRLVRIARSPGRIASAAGAAGGAGRAGGSLTCAGRCPGLADGIFGPLRRVGAEQLHVVPEQGGHANGGMGAELFDVEPETVGVSGAQFLLSDTTGGPVLHDHPEAVDDLTGVLCRRVVRSAGAVARGLVAYDVSTVGPDTLV